MIPGYLLAPLSPHSNDRDSKGSKEIQTKKKGNRQIIFTFDNMDVK